MEETKSNNGNFSQELPNGPEITPPSIINKRKFTRKIFIIVLCLFLFLVISISYLYKNNLEQSGNLLPHDINKLNSPSQTINNTQAFVALPVHSKTSSIIAFIRNGDLWTSSLDGSNQNKITTHTPILYTYRHYLSGNNIDAKWDDNFATQPRLSGDGKYIAYLEISNKAIDELHKWQEDVKTEPAETKNSGNSIAFNPPGVYYDFKIYDLFNKKEILLTDKLVDKSVKSSSYDLYSWAKDKNILSFNWNSRIHFLFETAEGAFSVLSLDKDFAPGPMSNEWSNGEWDTPSGVNISPDGNSALAYYQFTNPGQSCFNTWGYKSYFLDLINKKFTKLPLDKTLTCQSDNIGWIGNGQFYLLEYRPSYDFKFSLWSSNNLSRQEVLGYKGKISNASVSPDGRWLVYFIKNVDTDVSEYAFFDLKTKSGINLLGIMQEKGKKLDFGTIFTSVWNRDSQTAYVRMTRKSQEISDLIKFNPETKEYKIIIENLSEYNIN